MPFLLQRLWFSLATMWWLIPLALVVLVVLWLRRRQARSKSATWEKDLREVASLFKLEELKMDHPVLPLARYVWEDEWRVAEHRPAKMPSALRVLSQNLWFETHKQRDRTLGLKLTPL
jgi:hypothetical protein